MSNVPDRYNFARDVLDQIDPEATAAKFRGDWFITGDRAHVDDDGYFWFVGRADDVIITSGYRVGPFEIEFVESLPKTSSGKCKRAELRAAEWSAAH